MSHTEYTSPFTLRYSSEEMSFIFSSQFKYSCYRKLWVALMKAQKELGLDIPEKGIEEAEKNINNIDFKKVSSYEKKFRHDVMAHIHAYADQCPHAKGIIHLGATSAFVADNTDLLQMKEALFLGLGKLSLIIKELASFAKDYAYVTCIGYTHLQPAQPTTVGKRACLWLQDFSWDFLSINKISDDLPFLGSKGATGGQTSFFKLFQDKEKIKQLEQLIAKQFNFKKTLTISGQTYPRKIDVEILNALASFAASIHKMATDLRLLASFGEIKEQFNKDQVGSSAMPHKQNPIIAERICSLSRFLISLSQNPLYTLATQWLERSLDDSANRRLTIAEAFLSFDALLNLTYGLLKDLHVDKQQIAKNLKEKSTLLVLENILMLSVKKGKDRQKIHELLRLYSQKDNFLDKIKKDKSFGLSAKEFEEAQNFSTDIIGDQVNKFLKEDIYPLAKFSPKGKIKIPPISI
jgi:adenylosuccinate lyase